MLSNDFVYKTTLHIESTSQIANFLIYKLKLYWVGIVNLSVCIFGCDRSVPTKNVRNQ